MSDEQSSALAASESDPSTPDVSQALPLYYWAGKPNFGDLIGPWLVSLITGRPTINIRVAGREHMTGLATVGSLLNSLDRPDLDVWGSGSLYPLGARRTEALIKNRPRRIHAVRGYLSYREVRHKCGWRAPKVFGDPALLLPRYHKPAVVSECVGKVAVIPHFNHRDLFKNVKASERIAKINVLSPPKDVVAQIASSRCVISTSLHGVICAHAYEVPWVWLKLPDAELRGGEFKFEDFFTVMHRDSVASAELTLEQITGRAMMWLARKAARPKDKFDFDDLLSAFPYV